MSAALRCRGIARCGIWRRRLMFTKLLNRDRSFAMRLTANLALNGLNTFLNICFPLLTLPLAARALGPDVLGVVNFSVVLAIPLASIASIGITGYAIISIARLRGDEDKIGILFYELIFLQAMGAVPAWILFQGLAYFDGGWGINAAIFQIAGLNVLLSMLSSEWYFTGRQRFLYLTLRI